MKKLILLLVVISLVGVASAATVWNPFANGVGPYPAEADYGVAANWTNGIPTDLEKGVFNVPNAATCVISDTQGGAQLVQGDGDVGGIIRVASTGNITTKVAWTGIGYDSPGQLDVDAGGVFSFGGHAWIGQNPGGVGVVNIDGTVNVGQMLGIGWSGGIGTVNVNDGGVMNLQQLHGTGDSIKAGSILNLLGSGIVTKTSNFVGVWEDYIAGGFVTGNGIVGNVSVSYDDVTNLTTLVVPEPATMILLGLGGVLLRRKK